MKCAPAILATVSESEGSIPESCMITGILYPVEKVDKEKELARHFQCCGMLIAR